MSLKIFSVSKVLALTVFASHSIAIIHSFKSFLVISFPNTLHFMVDHLEYSFSSPLSTIDPSLKHIYQPHPHVNLGYNLKFLCVHCSRKNIHPHPDGPANLCSSSQPHVLYSIVPSDLSLDHPTVLNQLYLQEEPWKPNVI